MRVITDAANNWFSQVDPSVSVYDWCEEWRKDFAKDVYQRISESAGCQDMFREMGFYWHTEEELQDPIHVMQCFIFGCGIHGFEGLIESVRLEYQECA